MKFHSEPIYRPYQLECLETSFEQRMNGCNRQLVTLPTGSGKGVLFGAFAKLYHGEKGLVLAHRGELLRQAAQHFLNVNPMLAIGIEKADKRANPDSDIVLASIQSVGSKEGLKRLDQFYNFDYIITDEAHHCFLGETDVETPNGSVRISELNEDDFVFAFDGVSRVPRKIIRKFIYGFRSTLNRESKLIRFSLESGAKITCTQNHKLYDVKFSKKEAGRFKHGDILYSLWETAEKSKSSERSHEAQSSRSTIDPDRAQRSTRGSDATALTKSEISEVSIGANDEQEPNERRWFPRENAPNSESQHCANRSLLPNSRQWQGANVDGETLCGTIPTSGNGIRDSDRGRGDTVPLQSRFCVAQIESDIGDRREFPRNDSSPSGGQETRFSIEKNRLDNDSNSNEELRLVEDRIVAIELLDYSGLIYDIEVEELHNYFANGVLSSNSCAQSYRNVFEHQGFPCVSENRSGDSDKLLFGATATPKRTDNVGLEQVYDKIVYARTSRWMIEQGYLTDLNYHRAFSKESLDDVPINRGEFSEAKLSKAVNTKDRNDLIVGAYAQHAAGKRAIVFCVDVTHVHAVTNLFALSGIKAESITGESSEFHREGVMARFRSSITKVLVNCMVATEGFDVPGIDCVILARPTKSSLVYIQQLGRGMRPNCSLSRPGHTSEYGIGEALFLRDETNLEWRLQTIAQSEKPDCLVIDIVDNCKHHSPMMLATLYGLNKEATLEGRRIVDTVKKLEVAQTELKLNVPLEEIVDVDRVLRMKIGNEKINIWDFPVEISEEVCKHSKFSWIKEGEGYKLNVCSAAPVSGEPDAKKARVAVTMELVQDALGKWRAFETRDCKLSKVTGAIEKRFPLTRFCKNEEKPLTDVYEMFQKADRYISEFYSLSTTLLKHDANWKKEKPTSGQIERLKKWKFPIEEKKIERGGRSYVEYYIRSGGTLKKLDKGAASHYIGKQIEKWNSR